MTSIKKISLASFLLAIIFSVALTTSAQITGTSTHKLIQATPEEIAIMNSQPEVYVKDLVLDKNAYKAGDTVKGSFILVNDKDISVSNLSYHAFLVGDLQTNTLYRYEFDNQLLGTLFLDKNETKKVSFEYKLPLSSSAYTLDKQLGIKIRAFSGSGSPLGWADTKVRISDSGITPVLISNASVTIDGKGFLLNEGPTVHKGGKVSLKFTLRNDSSTDITDLTPKVSIYEMDFARSPLSVISENVFSLKAKSHSDFSFDLPTFNYTPKVYAGEVVVVDNDGVNRINPIQFRYIVYGEVVNIRNVSVDKIPASKGDTINVKVSYSGTPYDVSNFTTASTTSSDFSLRLFNEKDELVAQYADKTNFVTLGEKNIPLVLTADAKDYKFDVVVSKDGKVITEYKTSLIGKVVTPVIPTSSGNALYYWVVIIALIILIAGLFLLKKKKTVVISVVIFIIGLGMFGGKAEAWTVTASSAYNYASVPSLPQIQVNNATHPGGAILPGDIIYLAATFTVTACNNSNYKAIAYIPGYGSGSGYYYDYGSHYNACGGPEDRCASSGGSHSFGPFTAPATPGTYKINLTVDDQWDQSSPGSFWTTAEVQGYQEYTVVSLTPPDLIATAGACGGKTNLSWGAITGADSYKIYKNDTLLGTTASTTYNNITSTSTDRFVGKATFGAIDSASSTAVYAIPSSPCSALVASCSATPNNSLYAPVNVTWTATSTGGTGNYPYHYTWSGNNLAGNAGWSAGDVSSTTKTYTIADTYFATTTVYDGVSTATSSCQGAVGSYIIVQPHQPPSGSCSPNSSNITLGSSTVWTVSPVGGSTPYKNYQWSGSVSGTTLVASTTITYPNTAGSPYSAYVIITDHDNATSTTIPCGSVVVNPPYNQTLDCSLSLTAPLPAPVNINTLATFTASSTTGLNLSQSQYTKTWTVTDINNLGGVSVNDDTPANNTLDKIFTTIGQKTIGLIVSTSTATGHQCTATINIVQSGGSTREK